MTVETWYSKHDEVVVEYEASVFDYAGMKEVEIDVIGITVLGCPIKPQENPILVKNLKTEIRESI